MCVIMIVTFTESSASVIAVGDMVDRPADEKVVFGGVTVDALSSLLGGVFNSFMNGIMTQNIGLVALTRVRSRWVTTTAGVLMVVIGFIPKIGALVAGIPSALIGGVSIILFGQVAVVGIRRLTEVRWEGTHNALVAGIAISIGLFPAAAPNAYQNLPNTFQVLFGNAIVASAIAAFGLNLFLNELLPKLHDRGVIPTHEQGRPPGKYDWLE
jgi:NCS2 family nucleobase:cation symporter-2